jgi:hypothetical protein
MHPIRHIADDVNQLAKITSVRRGYIVVIEPYMCAYVTFCV